MVSMAQEAITVLECPQCGSDEVERTDSVNENEVITEFYYCHDCTGLYSVEYEAQSKEVHQE